MIAAIALYLRKQPAELAASAGAKVSQTVASHPLGVLSVHSRVHDDLHLLEPFVTKLGGMTEGFNKDLGVDVHIVTSNDTREPIEQQADRLFAQFSVGRNARTGGLLVLLNPALKRARIEVGYTLEGGLTDLHMSRIARDQLAPYFSYGVAGMAVMDVLHYLRDQVYVAGLRGDIALDDNIKSSSEYASYAKYLSGGAGAQVKLSSFPADFNFKQIVPADARSRYLPSMHVQESVEAFLRATADLVGDPTLDLFTEGSRLMRAQYPFAPFEEMKRLERISASRPLTVHVEDDYAVASSDHPAPGFVPILLHRERNVWRIDAVETWKNLFFDSEGNYYLRNSNTPYAKLLAQFGHGSFYNIGRLALFSGSLERDIAGLDGIRDVLSLTRQGDLWFRNAFVFAPAFRAFEAARQLAPNDPFVLDIISARAACLGLPELAIPAYEAMGRGVELELAEQYRELGNLNEAEECVRKALQEDPYDRHALEWQQFIAREQGHDSEASTSLAKLLQDERQPSNPVVLYFNPRWPAYDSSSTLNVDGTTVYDHSDFGVTMRNTSGRTVEIESVALTSQGDGAASGLGDIKNYWRSPAGGTRLGPGESVYFKKIWGFVTDTTHTHVRYIFRTCWHGVPKEPRQCRTQWIDVLPTDSYPELRATETGT